MNEILTEWIVFGGPEAARLPLSSVWVEIGVSDGTGGAQADNICIGVDDVDKFRIVAVKTSQGTKDPWPFVSAGCGLQTCRFLGEKPKDGRESIIAVT